MRKAMKMVMLLAVAVTIAGCGGKGGGSSAADGYVDGMVKIAAAVESVKDEADARKAAQVIASVNEDLRKTVAEMKEMSDAKKGLLFAQRSEDIQKAQMRLASGMQALASRPDLLRIISEEMQNMPTVK